MSDRPIDVNSDQESGAFGDKGVVKRVAQSTLAAWEIVARDKTALVAITFVFVLCVIAIFAPLLAPYGPTEQSMINRSQGPSSAFWLGTDEFGRDIFSRIIYATRPAIIIGVLSVLFAMGIGVPIGIISGYLMGWTDRITSWFVDIMLSFPSLLMALMIVTLLGSGPQIVVIAIGLSQIPLFIRLARSSTLVLKGLDYVKASQTFGAGNIRIMIRHILPNIIGPLIIMGTLSIAGAIRDEAALSFLGLGIQPPAPSWGNMIRDGINNIMHSPWLAIFPGIAVTITVLAFNMIGDSLRDIFDPRDIASRAQGSDKAGS
ncbi:ABC transporter permease [Fodinicurvata sp. EGI_FJ10296]|uniref:ABC transporter permease n=1 Tax=Fodinicurvata sp. EGI_FJ10296 TaxID=3231908 RepID=UPI0034532A88